MLVNQATRHAPPDAWRMSRFPRIRGPWPQVIDHGPRPGAPRSWRVVGYFRAHLGAHLSPADLPAKMLLVRDCPRAAELDSARAP